VIDDASAMISDANATGKHARNSQILAELEHRDSLAAWVAEAFTRSVRNNILAEGTAQAIRFAGILLFARLLSPSDFGHMRAVLAVSLIVTIFIQAGIPDAFIQRRDLSRYHECAG